MNTTNTPPEFFVEVILRDQSPSIVNLGNSPKFPLPPSLSPLIPFGNPSPLMFSYAFSNGHAYTCLYTAPDEGVLLVTRGGVPKKHPVFLADPLVHTLRHILVEVKQGRLPKVNLPQEPPWIDMSGIMRFSDLSGILFNILTKHPTLMIGDSNDSIQVIQCLISILPNLLSSRTEFAVNPVGFIGLPIVALDPRHVHKDLINLYLGSGYDLLDLTSSTPLTSFSSPVTSEIWRVLKERGPGDAQEMIAETISLAMLWKGEDPADFAERYDLGQQDADLLILISKSLGGGGT